jgi:hypothetical protein
MAKKKKNESQKSGKKKLLKDIELRLQTSFADYRKDVSEKKFSRKIRQAGKILKDVLNPIDGKLKKIEKTPKKEKAVPQAEATN